VEIITYFTVKLLIKFQSCNKTCVLQIYWVGKARDHAN